VGEFADEIERIPSMLKKVSFYNNEEGSAIVIALMILMVVTIIGVTSSNRTIMELNIVRNEGIYKQNLYLAEAAAQEAVQRIWNISRTDPFLLENESQEWLNDPNDPAAIDMTNTANWDDDGADNDDTALVSSLDADASLAVDNIGIASGGSLDISSGTNAHDFTVYGLGTQNNGRVFIQIGYRERF